MKNLKFVILFVMSMNCKRQAADQIPSSVSPCFDSERYGLPHISNDPSARHIRIWYSHSFVDRVPVVSLRQSKKGDWTGDLFVIIWNGDQAPPKVQETKRRKLEPQTSWEAASQKLQDRNIYSLPDMNQIPGLEDDWLDGSSYRVEIKNNDTCWSYSYHVPEKFQQEYWQAKNMVQILEEIKSEFGIPWSMTGAQAREDFWIMANDTTLREYK